MTAQGMERRALIVVGVDGSDESRAALRSAADEAVAHGARVEVVTAYELPFVGLATSYAPAPAGLPDPREYAGRAEETLDRAVQDAFGDKPPVDLERVVERGDPAEILLRRSRAADLLVVGSRGLGGFPGLLMGSVSEKCVRHAGCSVLVVRAEARTA